MTLQEKLQALFKEAPEPKSEVRRYESIRFLNGVFKDAVIRAAGDIPDDCKEELDGFLKHAWKAYVIAMSAHDMHVISPRSLSGTSEDGLCPDFTRTLVSHVIFLILAPIRIRRQSVALNSQ